MPLWTADGFVDDHSCNRLAVFFLLRRVHAVRLRIDRKAVHRMLDAKIFELAVVVGIVLVEQQDPPRSEKTFIYMLAFPDRETAKARWDAFHRDPQWLKVRAEFESRYGKIVDKVESEFVSPVDFSPLK